MFNTCKHNYKMTRKYIWSSILTLALQFQKHVKKTMTARHEVCLKLPTAFVEKIIFSNAFTFRGLNLNVNRSNMLLDGAGIESLAN